jgi:ubiquinone/menaquinone biosynthesis C-methylase UbiE
MNIVESACFLLAKHLVLSRKAGEAGENSATFDVDAYQSWRSDELKRQFTGHFSLEDIKGKDVYDFGCGGGALSMMLSSHGVRSIVGSDLNPQQIAEANRFAGFSSSPVTPKFHLSTDSTKIEFPDQSFDVILCFDVLEHILDYKSIFPEWLRVLRPGGKVMIWWVPWFNPYGHHVESLVPIPWAHAIFSQKTLINTCARIYDMPEFKPRWWDLDANGNKKPNKWRNLERLPDLNMLKIGEFEALCKDLGLNIAHREIVGFGGSTLGRLTRFLTKIPLIQEFFCSRTIYCLAKD